MSAFSSSYLEIPSGGKLTTAGAFSATFTFTGLTEVNFPESGTLSAIDAPETLLNKTLTAPTIVPAVAGEVVQTLTTTATNDDVAEKVFQARVATTDATVTTIATIAIPTTTSVLIEARVVARRTGGSSGTAEDGAAYVIYALYKNVAGTATEINETTAFTGESQSGWDCSVSGSGGDALIRVTGAANNNVTWHVTYRTYSVSS